MPRPSKNTTSSVHSIGMTSWPDAWNPLSGQLRNFFPCQLFSYHLLLLLLLTCPLFLSLFSSFYSCQPPLFSYSFPSFISFFFLPSHFPFFSSSTISLLPFIYCLFLHSLLSCLFSLLLFLFSPFLLCRLIMTSLLSPFPSLFSRHLFQVLSPCLFS